MSPKIENLQLTSLVGDGDTIPLVNLVEDGLEEHLHEKKYLGLSQASCANVKKACADGEVNIICTALVDIFKICKIYGERKNNVSKIDANNLMTDGKGR